MEVRCLSGNNPCHIELEFSDGEVIVIGEHSGRVDLSLMKAGYHGTGADCFYAFLTEARFNVTLKQVANMKNGTILRRDTAVGSMSLTHDRQPVIWGMIDSADKVIMHGETVLSGTGDLKLSDVKKMKTEGNIDGLINALNDNDKNVHCSAVRALGEIGGSQAVEPLLSAIKYDDNYYDMVGTRMPLVEALVKIGIPAVNQLIAAMKSEDWRARWTATVALGKIGDTRAVGHLIVALKDERPGVRCFAATGLAEIGDVRAVEPLKIAMAKEKDRGVKSDIRKALDELGRRKENNNFRNDVSMTFEDNSAMSSTKCREACSALYVFNSTKISDEVSGSYGVYAEGELLKALSKAIEPEGGWTAFPPIVQACHGDIGASRLEILQNWIRTGTYGIDAAGFEPKVLNKDLGFITYVVGIGPVQESHALQTHQGLKDLGVVGYMGVITLNHDQASSLGSVANALGLICDMKINGKGSSKCSGWLASSESILAAGLANESPILNKYKGVVPDQQNSEKRSSQSPNHDELAIISKQPTKTSAGNKFRSTILIILGIFILYAGLIGIIIPAAAGDPLRSHVIFGFLFMFIVGGLLFWQGTKYWDRWRMPVGITLLVLGLITAVNSYGSFDLAGRSSGVDAEMHYSIAVSTSIFAFLLLVPGLVFIVIQIRRNKRSNN